MKLLIEAGANVNSRCCTGITSLHAAAQKGHIDAIKLAATPPDGTVTVPLDMAVRNGRLEVVRELIQELGIEGRGGPSGGVRVVELVAQISSMSRSWPC